MKIAVLHGQRRKGSTWHITRQLLDKLSAKTDTDIAEFYVGDNTACTGCFSCFLNGEDTCPHYGQNRPAMDALEAADLIVVDSPCYCMEMSGQLKVFMDHMAYRWMSHRPGPSMFCKLGVAVSTTKGVEFVMNGANHRMNSVTTYPFNIMGGGWEKATPALADLPFKGDTVVGNDVWIGQNVTVLPGVHIGDGAIIAACAVVAKDVPPYTIVGGNPAKVVRKRFDDELIAYLLELKWWDWPVEKIFENLEVLCSADLGRIRRIDR